jgi:alkaline phosphatase D
MALSDAHVVGAKAHQATGVKVGEVTQDSAIVWMRLTRESQGRHDGVRVTSFEMPENVPVDELVGQAAGMAGEMRLRYADNAEMVDARETPWTEANAEKDYTVQFKLAELKPETTYHYAAESRDADGNVHGDLRGRFRTADEAARPSDVTFTVVTGMMFRDLDDPAGFEIYESMRTLKPDFIVPTGDTVYYDNEAPRAVTAALARYHWHRMYSLPRHIAFHLEVPGYWLKDDHDTLDNDCWPPRRPDEFAKMLPMTFEKGQTIYREQVPMGESTYRTVRWGRDVQIWLMEGRDFRSPNPLSDGPEKTIWGQAQKQWLMEGIKASTATWKFLLSPTPIVGPDRSGKADNHANDAFRHEGDEIRRWFQQYAGGNFFVFCGDRHWQYHSVHPDTGVQEFSCGPASDQHAGGSPGQDKLYHKFHRVKGGFISVTVESTDDRSEVTIQHHDVHGQPVYAYRDQITLPR